MVLSLPLDNDGTTPLFVFDFSKYFLLEWSSTDLEAI